MIILLITVEPSLRVHVIIIVPIVALSLFKLHIMIILLITVLPSLKLHVIIIALIVAVSLLKLQLYYKEYNG